MRWRKRGLIFSPSGQRGWMQTHATSPFAHQLEDGLVRIFFSTRDAANRAHLAFVDTDPRRDFAVVRICDAPALAPGALGFFDDHGVYAKSLLVEEGASRIYYLGWNPGGRSPLFYASIGLAISRDGGVTFERHSPAPIIQRAAADPWCVLIPFVRIEDGQYRMWYGSGIGWIDRADGSLQSIYDIKYAVSEDGVNWVRDGHVCIPLKAEETNVAHPCVVRDGGTYRMWYSREAGGGYRIGYAESGNGIDWHRKDGEAGIDVSDSGWDSQMVCHPFVFDFDGRRFMLYNGNAHGRDGIGLAEAD